MSVFASAGAEPGMRPEAADVRPSDPNVLQRKASNPRASVWVGASAGTGKTKVLTDRVLRLLLPREDGAPGTAAHKILCLTFTKAGAGEMALRVSATLARWAVMPEDGDSRPGEGGKGLRGELRSLLGREAGPGELAAARRLFAEVIDTPGGLKIMTIHSFCQSVLGRFPVEAGLSPQFSVLEEGAAAELLEQARMSVLKRARREKSSPLARALRAVAEAAGEEAFFALLRKVSGERRQLESLARGDPDLEGFYTRLCVLLRVRPGASPESMLQDFCNDGAESPGKLESAAEIMLHSGTKTDKEHAAKMLRWLKAPPAERPALFPEYKAAFLTGEDAIRKKLAGKDACEADPGIPGVLLGEAERILDLLDSMNAARIALYTTDLLRLCLAVLNEYRDIKARQGGLDFSDLVLHTLNLLEGGRAGSGAGWVHYKLDRGLEHLLIDEAQDTNPEQWRIAGALCGEFFSGSGAAAAERTVFTVGDEKQSIYSFQRASPEDFARMQRYFAGKAAEAGRLWEAVPMNISFRSTKSVLAAVDAVFARPEARKGLGGADIRHHAFRSRQAGLVELWPLFSTDGDDADDPWSPLPPEGEKARHGTEKLAEYIARTIRRWLDEGEILPSHGRPVRPGDIMILMRKRTGGLVGRIVLALRNLGVPVGGLDRMVLGEQIAVQDALAALAFALQPGDDLNLACFLKSPFVGLGEEALYELCIDRGGQSLWGALRERGPESLRRWLEILLRRGRAAGPFDFLAALLQEPCPGDPVSGRRAMTGRLGHDATDSLDELLNAALDFERRHGPCPQHFMQAQQKSRTEIRREQEGGWNEVRIMTVHGAKGLQAPIVIMPDTTSLFEGPGKSPESRLIWPVEDSGDGRRPGERPGEAALPLWSPGKKAECRIYAGALSALHARAEEEYRRLLYVAMTRAEDRLYIAGAEGKRAAPQNCWYNLVREGLEAMEAVEKDGESGILRLSNTQEDAPDRAPKALAAAGPVSGPPGWLFEPVPAEEAGRSVLRPSGAREAACSPLRAAEGRRFLRGNLTHKLLQTLPGVEKARRAETARLWLARYGLELSAEIRESILSETLAILDHPRYSAIFGPGSLAEAPVTGTIEGRGLVHGQIDRLLIGAEEILIIDFKTNRPPPKDPGLIPPVYREQMEIYAAILRHIYPGRPVRAALLWTDGPVLMDIF